MKAKSKTLWLMIAGVLCASVGALVVWAEESDEEEKSVTLEQVPAAVRAVIEHETKDAKDLKITSESDDGFTVFEAEFAVGGVEKSINFTDDGAIFERESIVSNSAIPAGLSAKIKAEHPKAEIKEVEEVVSTYYEVTLVTGGKEREVKFLANGQEVESED